MKAKIINGEIVIGLPKFYTTALKTYVGDFDKQSDEIHAAEGFFDIGIPDYDTQKQKIGNIYFDEENLVFTYLIEDIIFNLDELKQNLFNSFDVVLNEFAVTIARCKFIHDPAPEGLLVAIEMAKTVRINTINAINALSSIEAALAFRIREEDVESLRALFRPYQ